MRLRFALPALAAFALAACASTEPGDTAATPEGRDCFNARNVTGYTPIDNNHVGISVGANRKYILTTMFNARDLDWTQTIAIRSTTDWICTGNGLGVEIIAHNPPSMPRRNYPITAIERAPDEAPNADQGS